MSRRPPPPFPVTIITGFLGAGKTTLLNRLLADPALADTAVLINEFGAVALDHLLVREMEEGIIMLSSGCICCSVRGDLVTAFEDLIKARDNDRIPPFARIIIETTGLADPIPVIHTLMAHPYLALRLRLAAVITVVDVVNGPDTLDTHPEALRQISAADRLVLTKTDLVADAASLAAFKTRLATLAPQARPLDAATGEANADAVLAAGLWSLDGKSADFARWLAEETTTPAHAPHHDGVKTFALTHDRPIAAQSLELFLEFLRSAHGPKLLRLKGIVQIAENPAHPLVIHGAQHLMHPPDILPAWPDEDRRTRLVFIVRDADEAAITALFHAFANVMRPDTPDRQALTINPLALLPGQR